jgi:hypothetical protein
MADAPPIARWRQIGCAIKTLRAEAKVRLTGFSEREWRGQILYGVQPQLGCGAGIGHDRGSFASDGRSARPYHQGRKADLPNGAAMSRAPGTQLATTEWVGGSAPRLDDAALRLACNNLVEFLLERRKSRPAGN